MEREIDCDEYGRILVRFHWDLNDAYSMRCRVSQNWASKGWGGMVIPRIGMEVVVEFLEGDPDKPLVTGCVYNGANRPPYELPKHKTRSTFKTDTHQGRGFNELRFEDEKGREEVFLHAQRDISRISQNNMVSYILGGLMSVVKRNANFTFLNSKTETIRGSLNETVGFKDKSPQFPSFRNAHQSLDAEPTLSHQSGNKISTVSGSYQQQAGYDINLTSGKETVISAEERLRTISRTLDLHACKQVSITSEDYTVIDSMGAIRLGNYMARIVLTRSGDIRIIAEGTITINGKRINLN